MLSRSIPSVQGCFVVHRPIGNTRDQSLDALRVFTLLSVIAMHAIGEGYQDVPMAFAVDHLTRFAVPTFFTLAGFFWRSSELDKPGAIVAKMSRRVLPAFLLWLGIYWMINQIRMPDPWSIEPSFAGFVALFWAGEPDAYHLWYLPGLVVGAAIAAGLHAWLGMKRALLVGLVLYAAGLALGSYGKLLDVHLWRALYRNGVLLAPIFLLAGIWLRQNEARVRSISTTIPALAVLICARLQLSEADFLRANGSLGNDFGVATLAYGIVMVVLFLTIRVPGRFWGALGTATFGAYLIHLLVVWLVIVQLGERLPFPVFVVTCGAVTFAAVLGFQFIRARWASATGAPRLVSFLSHPD